MSWLSGWSKRIQITISNTNIDSALTHFPVLLYISASSGTGSTDVSCVFDELASDANRKKIAVTKSDGYTEIYVEIQKWDDANEKAWLWVSKSDLVLADDGTTVLYLYYDKNHADNTTYVGDTNDAVAENVWNANFKAVWHMRDGVDNAHIYDSTGNDNDGTKTGANAPLLTASGKIGEAQHFDGGDDVITIVENGTLDITGAITIEALVRFDAITDVLMPIFQKRSGSASNIGLRKGVDGQAWSAGKDELDLENYGTAWCIFGTDAANFAATTWYHIAFTYDDTTHLLYKDGASIAVSEEYGTCPQDLTVNNHQAEIGALSSEGNWFDGIIDEVRISDVARSAAWLKATVYTNNDAILAWGAEESSMGHGAHAFSLT